MPPRKVKSATKLNIVDYLFVSLFGVVIIILLSLSYATMLGIQSDNASNFESLSTITSNNSETISILEQISENTTPEEGQIPIFVFLRDSSNSSDQSVDGSVTNQRFLYTVPAGCELSLHRMIFYLQDSGSIDSGGYANGVALTNGLEVNIFDHSSNIVLDLLDGETIRQNINWNQYAFDLRNDNFASGDESLTIRWTFSNSGLPLMLKENESFGITVRDNLLFVSAQRANIQGTLICV